MFTPPKYPSTPHWPESQSVHRDDSYHTRPEVFVNRPVVITEKLDGGNTCLYRGEVYARSVAAPARDGWFAMVKKHHAWKLAHRMEWGYAIYGEDMYGIHSIEYEPMREEDTYRVFAIRDTSMSRNYFESWDHLVDIAARYDMRTVPVLFRGKFESMADITAFFEEELEKPSSIGGEREGFVMRIDEGFDASIFHLAVCKYVRPNHVQTDEHWRRNWKPCRLTSS